MQTAVNSTAQRLITLASLYQEGQSSQLMDRTLEKLLAHEAEQAHAQLAELNTDLGVFEQQYGMDSSEFMEHYHAGQTDDRLDFVEWASLLHMRANLLHRLELLTGENAA